MNFLGHLDQNVVQTCLPQSEKKVMLKVLERVDTYQTSDEILSKRCYVQSVVCEFLGRLVIRDK